MEGRQVGRYGPGARKYARYAFDMFGRVSNVGRNACDGERIRYKRTIESRFYTPPGSIYVSRISLDAREKDGLNEASIKSPFIAATGAIRLRE